jgi:hypothetical protein
MPGEAGVAAVGAVVGAAARAGGALGPAVGRDRAVAADPAAVLGLEVAVGPAAGIERPPSASPVAGEWVVAGAPAAALAPILAAGREAESIGRISVGGPGADGLMSVGPEALAVVLASATARAGDAPISDDRESPAADLTLAAGRGLGIGRELIAVRESRSCLRRVRTLAGGVG